MVVVVVVVVVEMVLLAVPLLLVQLMLPLPSVLLVPVLSVELELQELELVEGEDSLKVKPERFTLIFDILPFLSPRMYLWRFSSESAQWRHVVQEGKRVGW